MKNAYINPDQKSKPNDPLWYFLAEFPLREFLSNHGESGELTAGLLLQTVRELGLPPECIEKIDVTLKEFAKKELEQSIQGRREIPERVRIFCQKKKTADVISAKSSLPDHSEHVMESAQLIRNSCIRMGGGWGFFLVESGGNASTDSSASLLNSIDLFLYKEY